MAERTRLAFQAGDGWELFALALVTALVLTWLGVRATGGTYGGRRVTLVVLRIVLAASVVLLALRPVLRRDRLSTSAQPVAVIVDSSASMDVRDQPEGRSRLEQVAAWMGAHSQELDGLEAEALVDWFAMADGSLRSTSRREVASGALAPAGGTDIARALKSVGERYPGRPRPPVVLFTDGADHGALRDAVRDGSPLGELLGPGGPVVVVLPDPGGFVDLAVDLVAHDPVGFLRMDVTVRARVRASGLGMGEVPVSLLRGEQVVSVKTVQVGGDVREADVVFTLQPTRVGESLYSLKVPVQAGESVSSNNEAAFSVRVVRDRLRVLQIVGRPSWDGRFLREMLKRDPAIDLISFFILRSPWDDPAASVDELSLIPFPVAELFDNKLSSFDLIIFQDVELSPYGIQYHLAELKRHVLEQGGALAVVGGDLAFGDDYRTAEMDAVLPVSLGMRVQWSSGDVPLRATDAGQRHPILRQGVAEGGVGAAIAELLPVRGLTTGLSPKAGAQVLLETADDRQIPVAVAAEAGEGRVLVLATDGTWRWSLPMAGAGRSPRGYERFWGNALRWLVRDPRSALLSLEADRRTMAPGESVELRARISTDAYEPAAGEAVKLVVTDASGRVVKEEALTTGEDGVARMAFEPARPGPYAVNAETSRGKAGPLFVERADKDLELADATLGEAEMAALVNATQGAAFRMSDARLKLPFTLERDERVEASSVFPLWRTWWAWALVAGVACIEWWLRRRWGLA